MGTRKVMDAVNLETGESVYFNGHAQATYMSDGRTVEDAIKQSGSDIYADLGLSKDRLSELLARDFYCPLMQEVPTSATLTYTDTDGSVHHFAVGQECRVPDVESLDYSVYKFLGTYEGEAVWQKLPGKLSDLENDTNFYSGANVQVVDADEELDEPNVTYLTTAQQVLSDEEKETVKANLGIVEKEVDLTPYATKEELEPLATKEELNNKPAAYSQVEHDPTDTTFTLTPNVFHVWGEVDSLDLSFGPETEGIANEFLFQFTSSAEASALTLPESVKWINGTAPVIQPGMTYQISILRGFASVLEFNG